MYDELITFLKEWNKTIQKRQNFIKGYLGDGQGNVLVPGRDDYHYARFTREGADFFEIFNKNTPAINNLPVLIGEYEWQPGLTQIIGTNWDAYVQSGWGEQAQSNAHAPSHEWRDGSRGSDSINVYSRAIAPGRGYIVDGEPTTFYVNSVEYGTGTVWPGTPGIDLSGALVLSTGSARLMGVYINPDSNALGIVTGTQSVYTPAIDPPLVKFPANVIPIARVLNYGGQAAFAENDIRDARRWLTRDFTQNIDDLRQEISQDIDDLRQYTAASPTELFYWASVVDNTDFVATINGAPSGATLVYNAPTSGNENVIKPNSTTAIAKMVLHNTTRGNDGLITDVDTGTNTITLTENVPGDWQSGDSITCRSQTNTNFSGGAYFADFEITSVVPDNATFVNLFCYFNASGAPATNFGLWFHPFSAFVGGQVRLYAHAVANVFFGIDVTVVPIISKRFCCRWNNPTGTNNVILRVQAYYA